jgi:UDP:flavonoid glycosyltransferase YjiC (YdhE family)
MEALGLGRTLSPDAAPAAIGGAVMDMLGDETLRAASRSFAAGVSRFGELTHAADLIERAVLNEPQRPVATGGDGESKFKGSLPITCPRRPISRA